LLYANNYDYSQQVIVLNAKSGMTALPPPRFGPAGGPLVLGGRRNPVWPELASR
jgi:hypothetical protein